MPFLLIDKPAGITSHDVVDRVRKITGERTVGHAGTLDPFATGMLILGVGRESTKHLNTFLGMGKTYEAIIRLGESSTTLDPEGEIVAVGGADLTLEAIETAMKSLTGDILQIPPMHSAIKIGGQKLYDLARKGIEIDRPPRPVKISRFVIQDAQFAQGGNPPVAQTQRSLILPLNLPVVIDCSSGTYIRAIARDLGENLGTAGYLTQLRRSAIGPYGIDSTTPLSDITPENWASLAKKLVP
ncbi:MAG: tRNA pseudouridine(55) synthase TruB [Patescibacteria group bacterium]